MLTQKELRGVLSYEKTTGAFTWIACSSTRMPNGSKAGALRRGGYVSIRINGKSHAAHRLVWLYEFGRWPEDQIDHINGNPGDNRLDNLREADSTINGRNKKMLGANTSGVCGVKKETRWHLKKPWYAYIKVDRKPIYLGYFATKMEAAEARRKADESYGFHPSHGRRK